MTYLVRLKYFVSLSILLLITLSSHASNLQPAMWKVEHQGVTSYILGSIHIGKSDWYPLPSYITNAFNESDALVVELDAIANSAAMTSQMMLPAGQTLQNNLSPQVFKKLDEYLTKNGMPLAAFTQFKPWAVATVVAVIPYLKAGLDPTFGIDSQLITHAKNKNKNMALIELETAQFQINLLSGLFSDEKMLIELMELPDYQTKQLIDFWAMGNIDKIDDLMQQQMTPEQRDVMLTKRNTNWIEKLVKLFNTNKSNFVVVGAAHLAGDKGLPTLLLNAGIKVTRIK